jgi:molybdopterin adenylyltransferase
VKAAVITVSDSAHRGEREDMSGPGVKARLEHAGFTVEPVEVLPDERAALAARIRAWCDSAAVDAVFLTGGTGVAPRDVTPEAVRDAMEREIPGFGETMRAEGRKKTPLAPLSRSLAATRGRVLIVALPGSPKGAAESLDAILEMVPHVLKLLRGETGH